MHSLWHTKKRWRVVIAVLLIGSMVCLYYLFQSIRSNETIRWEVSPPAWWQNAVEIPPGASAIWRG